MCLLFILHPRGRPALPRMWAHLALPGDDRLRARFRSMSLLFEFFYIVIVMIIMTKHCKSVTYVNPSVGQKWKSHVYKFIIYLVELTHIKRIVQFQNHYIWQQYIAYKLIWIPWNLCSIAPVGWIKSNHPNWLYLSTTPTALQLFLSSFVIGISAHIAIRHPFSACLWNGEKTYDFMCPLWFF
jgi:hypothetical protein